MRIARKAWTPGVLFLPQFLEEAYLCFWPEYVPLPVCLKINTKDGHFKKGGNYWKFNSSLLKDNIFVTGLKEMVESKRVEYMGMDNQIKWELIKFEIRKFAMNYSKKVAREGF